MRSFSYQRATSINEAATLLADPSAAPLGGGTDLLVCIEEGIASPSTLVDLRSIAGVEEMSWSANGAIVFAPEEGIYGLRTISSAGGDLTPATTVGGAAGGRRNRRCWGRCVPSHRSDLHWTAQVRASAGL